MPKKNNKRRSKTSNRAHHRLHSIQYDIHRFVVPALHKFVEEWQQHEDNLNDDDSSTTVPCIYLNERCGTWYWPRGEHGKTVQLPRDLASPKTCHFKSTDGHFGCWLFSLKRLNLPVLYDAVASNGCLILDSSVHKDMPDSFSRTVPLWTAVWNRAAIQCRRELGINEDGNNEDTAMSRLKTPRWIVDEEEHAIMDKLVQQRVEELLQSGAIVDPRRLATTLRKPLCPFWCSTQSQEWPTALDYKRCIPIICLNASQYNFDSGKTSGNSRRIFLSSATHQPFWYTPGAADDEESWARSLTPALFWEYGERLLGLNDSKERDSLTDVDISNIEDDTDLRIDSVVAECKHLDDNTRKSPTLFDWLGSTSIAIGSRRAGRPPECWDSFDAVLNVTDTEYPDMIQSSSFSRNRFYIQLPVKEGKRDRAELERWMAVGIWFCFVHALQHGRRVLIHCAQGRDRSVCVALSVVVLFCDLGIPLRWKKRTKEFQLLGERTCFDTENDMHLESGIPSSVVEALLGRPGRDLLLRAAGDHYECSDACGDSFPVNQHGPANKETLRIGLHLVRQYREQAEPTRSNMQKLNRFFMSARYDGSKQPD